MGNINDKDDNYHKNELDQILITTEFIKNINYSQIQYNMISKQNQKKLQSSLKQKKLEAESKINVRNMFKYNIEKFPKDIVVHTKYNKGTNLHVIAEDPDFDLINPTSPNDNLDFNEFDIVLDFNLNKQTNINYDDLNDKFSNEFKEEFNKEFGSDDTSSKTEHLEALEKQINRDLRPIVYSHTNTNMDMFDDYDIADFEDEAEYEANNVETQNVSIIENYYHKK